jgi:hypothetical protein
MGNSWRSALGRFEPFNSEKAVDPLRAQMIVGDLPIPSNIIFRAYPLSANGC